MNKKTIYYLLMLLAFVVLPIVVMCGCDRPQAQFAAQPGRPVIVLQVFTIQDRTCQQCEDDKPNIAAIQSSGYCQVEIIDANDARAAGIRDFPEYRVWVNGSLYCRTNNLRDLYRLIPQ